VQLDEPKRAIVPKIDVIRRSQSSSFLKLPSDINLQILSHLISDLSTVSIPSESEEHEHEIDIATIDKSSNGAANTASHQANQDDRNVSPAFGDMSALLSTCSQMRYLDIPPSIWRRCTEADLANWKAGLLHRWKTSASGGVIINQLGHVLEEEFAQAIRIAFDRISRGKSALRRADLAFSQDVSSITLDQGSAEQYTARDVFDWWRYGEVWQSRRRVWYCVVHASATARDADW